MTGPEVTQPDPDGGVEMTDGEFAAFRGVEVTAAMKAEDVDASLVEKAARALRDAQCTGHDHGTDACPDRHCRDDRTLPFYRARVRPVLAADLAEIQAQAWDAGFGAATDAAPSDVWLPAWDDTDNPYRAARITAVPEKPTRPEVEPAAHDPRCISLTDSEFNDHCDCRTLAMIDRETKGDGRG